MARRLETLFDRYRRRGDAAALGQVFDRTAPEILRVAMHLARHPVEAEDLLQETFLTAIARAGSYDATRPLVPWLLGILRNHARAARRRRTPWTGSLEDGAALREPWMALAWSADLARPIEALPDPYREVLVLLLRHERSAAEIAILLDRPPATVRSQIHRGLDRLRRSLPRDAQPPVLAALPVGVGLDVVRAKVMSEAAAVAAGASVATGTLSLVGALVMPKKILGAAAVLLALLALGTAAWQTGLLDRGSEDAGPTDRAGLRPSREASGDLADAPPVLVGAPSAARPPVMADTPPEADPVPPRAWPPTDPIPDDRGSVAGAIRFEDGTPLVGARVALWGSSPLSSVTDEQGRYHIHADWVHDRAVFIRLGPPDAPDWMGLILSSAVVMKPGQLVMRDVTIQRGVDIEGTVVDERTDEPLVGATVTLRHHAGHWGQATSGFLHTDEQGRFRFPYVIPEAYTLELEQPGYESRVSSFDLTAGRFPDRWTLRTARRLHLRFENLPPAAVGTEINVDLSSRDATQFSTMTAHEIRPDGTVNLDAPQPGPYRLTIYKTDHVPRVERRIEITAAPLEPIVVTLPAGARVEGTIRDADGRPIAGARVSIREAAGRPTSDADGGFAFERVQVGARVVWVEVGDAWVRFGTVEVPERGTLQVELAAPGLARLEGTFLLGGTPVGRFDGELKVRVADTQETVATVRHRPTGRFVVPMLRAGRYEVVAWSTRGVPRIREVVLHRGESLRLGAIDLQPYLRVPVELVFPPGAEPPEHLFVHAYDAAYPDADLPSGVEVGRTRHMAPTRVHTEEDGRTWVEGLPPGSHRLEFLCEGYEAVVVVVEAAPGAVAPTRVAFTRR